MMTDIFEFRIIIFLILIIANKEQISIWNNYQQIKSSQKVNMTTILTKIALRKQYRIIKRQLLTTHNKNDYHSNLKYHLKQILTPIISNISGINPLLLIASYINKPDKQIIPPFLSQIQIKLTNTYHYLTMPVSYAYPYFNIKSKQMQFYIHNWNKNNSKYQIGSYGVKILSKQNKYLNSQCQNSQNKSEIKDVSSILNAVLVPLVAFDQKSKNRVGEGGGYYDYFIKSIRNKQSQQKSKIKTIFIGIGLEKLKIKQPQQKINQIFDQNDQPLDYIITESTIYR